MQAIAREMNLSETTFVTEPMAGRHPRAHLHARMSCHSRSPQPRTALHAGAPGSGAAAEPVTPVRLELNVGPTLVDVHIEDGERPARSAPEHAYYGARIPRAERPPSWD